MKRGHSKELIWRLWCERSQAITCLVIVLINFQSMINRQQQRENWWQIILTIRKRWLGRPLLYLLVKSHHLIFHGVFFGKLIIWNLISLSSYWFTEAWEIVLKILSAVATNRQTTNFKKLNLSNVNRFLFLLFLFTY